jgi:hypothetical protein
MLGSRDPVDDGTRCGPHGGETSKTKSWTIEPVHGGGRVKRFGGRPGRAHGVWWFAHKTIGGRFLGLGLKTKSEGPTRRRRDPGVSRSFEAEDTRRDRMACVGRTRGAVKTWPLSYGPPWAHYLGGYQDRLLGGPLGLPGLHCTAPDGVKHKDYRGEVLG